MKKDSNYFRHCEKPTLSPIVGKVSGTVPAWLTGTMIRNGPGILKVGPHHYNHLFDGLAVLHRFHIQDGKVTYNSRALESDAYQKNMAAQQIVVSEFGTLGTGDPCDTLFNKFKSLFISGPEKEPVKATITDNCNINTAYYGDQLYGMTESSFLRRIDPETLKTVGPKTWLGDFLTVNQASAHPHILPDGTALNLGSNYRHKKGTHYCVIKVPPTFNEAETSLKGAKIIAEIPCRWKLYPSYYHSFGIAGKKLILLEQPYCFSLPRVLTLGIWRAPINTALAWHPNQTTRIHVISIEDGVLHPVIYEAENLFSFHHGNAYEKDGHIIFDICAYDNAEFIYRALSAGTDGTNVFKGPEARRYVLPLNVREGANVGANLVELESTGATAILTERGEKPTVQVRPETLLPAGEWFEFPRYNYNHNGEKYEYLYGVRSSAVSVREGDKSGSIPNPDGLIKVNVDTGKSTRWLGDKVMPSEPIFIRNPTLENGAEDDGVLLSVLLHENEEDKATLLVLDAKDMTEVARAEFKTEGAVTSTFHGQWAQTGEKVHGC